MLECRAIGGDPKPSLLWRRLDSKSFSSRIQQKISSGVIQIFFNIKDAHEEDFSVYECVATNSVGTV